MPRSRNVVRDIMRPAFRNYRLYGIDTGVAVPLLACTCHVLHDRSHCATVHMTVTCIWTSRARLTSPYSIPLKLILPCCSYAHSHPAKKTPHHRGSILQRSSGKPGPAHLLRDCVNSHSQSSDGQTALLIPSYLTCTPLQIQLRSTPADILEA